MKYRVELSGYDSTFSMTDTEYATEYVEADSYEEAWKLAKEKEGYWGNYYLTVDTVTLLKPK